MKEQEIVSVLKKLFFLFIAIVVFIYICTIATFLSYATFQKKRELGALQAAVSQGASTLREQLDIVSNMERNLVSDNRTSTLCQDIYLDGYERSQLVRGLISNMRGFQSMNNIIEEIAILYPRQEMELSTVNEFSRKKCIPAERMEGDTARNLVCSDGRLQMELWYPLTHSLEQDYIPDYGVRVVLDEMYLQELLELITMEEQSGGFSVLRTKEGLLPLSESTGKESTAQFMEGWRKEWENAGNPEVFQGNGRCSGRNYLYISESIPEYGITLVAYRDAGWIDGSTITALLVMGGVILLVSGMFLLMLYQTNMTVNKPLQKMVQAFKEVQEGNLNIRISHRYQDEFQYLYSAFNRMVERIQELIENVKEQGRLLQNAELMQLQSQINPHFLYNSFYLIRIMAKNESYEQIDQFVTSLAKYYRFLNREAESNIPLSREAEHMENYMDIQQMRFEDKITVCKGTIPEAAASFRVPKLILQPVVENAYNYGMANILQDGRIIVSYEIKENFLYICVEDNGNGADEEKLEQMREYIRDYQGRAAGHALSNIERRLKLAYGGDSGILLEKSGLGGLKVILKLDMNVQL